MMKDGGPLFMVQREIYTPAIEIRHHLCWIINGMVGEEDHDKCNMELLQVQETFEEKKFKKLCS